ncbi:hypothetical protein [Pseudonocardia sp. HH130630-07]|uniref:hypothetical protein n=1 Tax=Pseudonocardia sp. HH130630-07 TaxID=1690815 RepID=UPI0012EABB92|nr:hypothetical protein [Pseudonocardia sp. HH130630-07]
MNDGCTARRPGGALRPNCSRSTGPPARSRRTAVVSTSMPWWKAAASGIRTSIVTSPVTGSGVAAVRSSQVIATL